MTFKVSLLIFSAALGFSGNINAESNCSALLTSAGKLRQQALETRINGRNLANMSRSTALLDPGNGKYEARAQQTEREFAQRAEAIEEQAAQLERTCSLR